MPSKKPAKKFALLVRPKKNPPGWWPKTDGGELRWVYLEANGIDWSTEPGAVIREKNVPLAKSIWKEYARFRGRSWEFRIENGDDRT